MDRSTQLETERRREMERVSLKGNTVNNIVPGHLNQGSPLYVLQGNNQVVRQMNQAVCTTLKG